MYWANLVIAGLAAGAVYGLYGLGITLVYKSTRVPNFAHGAMGIVGAYVFYKSWDGSRDSLRIPWLHFQLPWTDMTWEPVLPELPMAAALLLALAVSALLGLAIDRLFMRYLAGAPALAMIVATIGILTMITGLAIDLFDPNEEIINKALIGEGARHVGDLRFTNLDLLIFGITVGLALGFGAFFRRTDLGIAIRATADSRETSRLLGINANQVAAFSWAVGSMLATVAAILIVSRSRQLGYISLLLLILPGFTAAMFGGFTSMVGTILGGLTLGVAEKVFIGIRWPEGMLRDLFSVAGAPTFVSFLVVVVVLMTRPKFIFKGIRVDEESGVGFVKLGGGLQGEDRLRRALDRRGALPLLLADWRTGRWILAAMATTAVLATPVFAVSYWSTVLGQAVFFALLVLSIVVLTGWTGQISFAPLAFAGMGAWAATILSSDAHLPFWLVFPLSGLIGVPIAVLVGVPALRLRGFFLALSTLAFAVAAAEWLFVSSFLSSNNEVDRGPLRDDLSQPAFLVSLFVAGLVFVAVRNLGRTRVARAFHAIRDSETTAVAMGIDPVRYKLLAFALAGFICGLAGASFAYMNVRIVALSFSFYLVLPVITYAAICGISLISGAIFAAVLFGIVPALTATTVTGVNQAPFILAGFLAVRTVIDYPNGLASFWVRLVRPFSPSERVAWASAEQEEAPAPAAAVADLTDDAAAFDRAQEGLVTTHG